MDCHTVIAAKSLAKSLVFQRFHKNNALRSGFSIGLHAQRATIMTTYTMVDIHGLLTEKQGRLEEAKKMITNRSENSVSCFSVRQHKIVQKHKRRGGNPGEFPDSKLGLGHMQAHTIVMVYLDLDFSVC